MDRKSRTDEENFQWIKLNDFLDIPLFFIGLLIPFIGDILESGLSFCIDLFLLYKLSPLYGSKARWVFFLEQLDLTDFFSGGLVDLLGWVELIPFWVLLYLYFQPQVTQFEKIPNEERKGAQKPLSPPSFTISSDSITGSNSKTAEKVVNSSESDRWLCSMCGEFNPPSNKICERCGAHSPS